MAWDECTECGWNIAEPGLACAIIGETRCVNCDHGRPLTLDERVEVGETFDQRIHKLESVEVDALRYRHLRNKDLGTIREGGVFAGLTPENVVLNLEDLDAAIDAEMKPN